MMSPRCPEAAHADDAAAAAGRPVRVTWHYQEQNESARECGQELAVGLRHLELRLVGRPG